MWHEAIDTICMPDVSSSAHASAPDVSSSAHASAPDHGRSDHAHATEALPVVADTTPLADRGFTTSAFVVAPSVRNARLATARAWGDAARRNRALDAAVRAERARIDAALRTPRISGDSTQSNESECGEVKSHAAKMTTNEGGAQ